ncbi:MAG: glycosyltransferase [Phycisphaerae bacterium]|nr:glycosyltransferase [Phycisphaerae bacterium]
MERGEQVSVVSPQPWCPLLRRSNTTSNQKSPHPRPSHQTSLDSVSPLPTVYPRMFSIPVVGWATDGLAFARALETQIDILGGPKSIDLIDAHFEYPDGVGAWLAARRLHIPVVVTVRGKIVSLSKKAIRRMQMAAMLRGVDARIAVSRSLAEWVRRIAGNDLEVDVIPNGVDTETFYPIDPTQARTKLGWQQNARYLLAVGHLQRVKGFDRIIEIMPDLRLRLGDVRLVLAGSTRGEWRFKQRVRKLIARCGGSPAVMFVGPQSAEQLRLMYNAADLSLNVARSEGWNNSISESLAVGTPVVAFDVGGNAEQIHSPQLGRIVPDGDANALITTIESSLKTKWNRVLIAAHGGSRGWNQVAREVQDVFRRVLQARAAATKQATPPRLFDRCLSSNDLFVSNRS